MIAGLILIGVSWSIQLKPGWINTLLEISGYVLEMVAGVFALIQMARDILK